MPKCVLRLSVAHFTTASTRWVARPHAQSRPLTNRFNRHMVFSTILYSSVVFGFIRVLSGRALCNGTAHKCEPLLHASSKDTNERPRKHIWVFADLCG